MSFRPLASFFSGRGGQVLTALAACFFLSLFLFKLFSGTGYYYFEKDHPPLTERDEHAAVIPTRLEGLTAGFSLPHQNRPGESFWLHLTLTCGPGWPEGRAAELQIVKLSLRDFEGRAVLLEGRRSANPDFARSVHFEDGALVGLRTLAFQDFFIAGIPFDLAAPPKQLQLDYAFWVRVQGGAEEKVEGRVLLERGTKRQARRPRAA